ATAYSPFTGLAIDTDKVGNATLVTFAPGAGLPQEGDLLFNSQEWNDVWNYTGSTQIGVAELNVTGFLAADGNEAAFRSSEDYMEAMTAVLIVNSKNISGSSGDVSLNVTIVPAISLEVTPSALDFGELYAGITSKPQYITLNNSGGCNITVTAEVSDSSAGAELFSKGLLLDSLLWSEYSKVIGTGSQANTAVALKVPSSSGFGNKKGTITFWAEAAE
ncbi:MAG: DUF3344 domain-containing protein, partial [Methanosarcinaceae archaeon]|nr:DUF3344 domain-containing protein [Methanosarcinaceae archaeon]